MQSLLRTKSTADSRIVNGPLIICGLCLTAGFLGKTAPRARAGSPDCPLCASQGDPCRNARTLGRRKPPRNAGRDLRRRPPPNSKRHVGVELGTHPTYRVQCPQRGHVTRLLAPQAPQSPDRPRLPDKALRPLNDLGFRPAQSVVARRFGESCPGATAQFL